jgi:flagellar protein FlgJ
MSFALNSHLNSQMEFNRQMASGPDVTALSAKTGNTPEAIQQVAEEFESLFMNMMLKSMRSANRTLSEGNYFNSFESKMYEDMLDEKLSVELSRNGGLGIADLLVRQLAKTPSTPTYQLEYRPDTQALFPAERKAAFDSQAEFIDTLLPKAKVAAHALGIEPEFIVAQAALETGWGQHVMHNGKGQNSHNLFGIKASPDWQGATVSIESVEVVDGVAQPVKSRFRAYPDYESAFADYAAFIGGSERYASVRNTSNVNDFTRGLADGGYATDPEYGNKVARVLDDVNATQIARLGVRK